MALNPFFLQGTSSEQRLVQDLINEQLRTFGVEVTYIPRKFVNVKSIIQEVQASKFDVNFSIEEGAKIEAQFGKRKPKE